MKRWNCANCGTSQPAAAPYCTSCGEGESGSEYRSKDMDEPVAKEGHGQASPQPQPPGKKLVYVQIKVLRNRDVWPESPNVACYVCGLTYSRGDTMYVKLRFGPGRKGSPVPQYYCYHCGWAEEQGR